MTPRRAVSWDSDVPPGHRRRRRAPDPQPCLSLDTRDSEAASATPVTCIKHEPPPLECAAWVPTSPSQGPQVSCLKGGLRTLPLAEPLQSWCLQRRDSFRLPAGYRLPPEQTSRRGVGTARQLLKSVSVCFADQLTLLTPLSQGGLSCRVWPWGPLPGDGRPLP